jgi:hypothetical protein
MTKEKAVAKIAELVQQAYDALNEAESVADEHKLDFSFSPAYGMGGTYYPAGHEYKWVEEGWNPSSQSC